MNSKLVSIITPFFNSHEYLPTSIQSVFHQSYPNWELLLINDGSRDNSKAIAQSFNDPRIFYFEQGNRGVSAARNNGLANMRGDYFCFLDADDILPENSLEARVAVFEKDPDIAFVDGIVERRDKSLDNLISTYQPSFRGDPFRELIKLRDTCFLGNTWMIKRKENFNYQFRTDITHSEDLLFYIDIAKQGLYSYTDATILYYRVGHNSAMKNLEGLENGYREVYKTVSKISEVSAEDKRYLKLRIMRIMALSYLRAGDFKNALRSGLSFSQL